MENTDVNFYWCVKDAIKTQSEYFAKYATQNIFKIFLEFWNNKIFVFINHLAYFTSAKLIPKKN